MGLLSKKTEEGKTQLKLEKTREAEAQEMFEKKTIAKAEGRSLAEFDGDEFKLDMRIRNQFDFAERASQTFNLTLRERVISTEPPPSTTVTGSVNQAEIYDTYIREIERQNYLRAKAEKEKAAAKEGKDPKKAEKEQAAPVQEKTEDVV